MTRFYYSDSVEVFLKEPEASILGKLAANNQFSLDDLQRNTWQTEIHILKEQLIGFDDGHILFEYTIPRIGKRIDAVLLYAGMVFLLEFKAGESNFPRHAINQVLDYALDLQDFHEASHDVLLVPLLICTEASPCDFKNGFVKKRIVQVQACNKNTISSTIRKVLTFFSAEAFTPETWIHSSYKPTPTIIEAAQALYHNHSVKDISRNDASAYNLTLTTQTIDRIIDAAKQRGEKAICFITGVPGAGKTLAGLNIAIDRQRVDADEHAVFLSGNGPLVDVLQEALARDQSAREGIKKTEALRKAKEFVQIIHHFRDDTIITEAAPVEKVVLYDEAQRAWTREALEKFMLRKKGKPNFAMSEPEFLVGVMDRHTDWAVLICLIGGGQEINTGEAGLAEWFSSLARSFPHWNVYISDKITDREYSKGIPLEQFFAGTEVTRESGLHLSVPLRSFRSENVASFVKALLDYDLVKAQNLYQRVNETYPIVMTRDLNEAKAWVKKQAKGTQRFGLTASSGAKRLKKYGVWVQSKIDAVQWFLNNDEDVRSSYFLEDTATEFDIQGLELDWCIVAWDIDLRVGKEGFEHYAFKGAKWQTIRAQEKKEYLKNSYRVLLTRARQGFVIFIPEGDDNDVTRPTAQYDAIYAYLKDVGLGSCIDKMK